MPKTINNTTTDSSFSGGTIASAITVTDTTESTTINTGAIISNGGCSVAKNLYVGGHGLVYGNFTISGSLIVNSISYNGSTYNNTEYLNLSGYLNVYGNTTLYGNETIYGNNSIYGNQTISGYLTVGSMIIYGTGSPSYNYLTSTSISGINSAVYSTSYGYDALKSITTGSQSCTAVGYSSSKKITTGKWNTSIGCGSLSVGTTSNNNVAVGYNTLGSCNGNQHTAVGASALGSLTSNFGNSALGYLAGGYLSNGQYNTFLGAQAGNNASIVGSNNCTYVGYATMNPSDYSYSTAIGNAATITAPYQIVLGTSTEHINIPSTIDATSTLSGSFVTAGGIAVAKSINVGSNIAVAGGIQTKHPNYHTFFNTSTTVPTSCNACTMVGYNCGGALTIGSRNTGFGANVLSANTSGERNTAIGNYGLFNNVSGSYNSAIGDNTLTYSTGSYNTALGYQAGTDIVNNANITTANACTYLGYNTTNSGNCDFSTCIGANSIISNSHQIVMGTELEYIYIPSLYDSSAINIGSIVTNGGVSVAKSINVGGNINLNSGSYISLGTKKLIYDSSKLSTSFGAPIAPSGTGCTGFGHNSLGSACSGTANTAYGTGSLQSITSGARNMAIGVNCMQSSTLSTDNVAIGYYNMPNAVEVYYNTAIGTNSLNNTVTSGNSNTGIGFAAGKYNTTGNNNTFIGSNSGDAVYNCRTQTNCTYIGYLTSNDGNYSYSTAIGNAATITAAHQIQLGTASENVNILGSLTIAGNTTLNGLNLGVSTITTATAISAPYSSLYFLNTDIESIVTLPSPSTNLKICFRRVQSNDKTVFLLHSTIVKPNNTSSNLYTIVSNSVELVYYTTESAWYVINGS
jgi:hypothetical protein